MQEEERSSEAEPKLGLGDAGPGREIRRDREAVRHEIAGRHTARVIERHRGHWMKWWRWRAVTARLLCGGKGSQQPEKPGAGARECPTLCNARRTTAHRARPSPPYAHGDGATQGRTARLQHMTDRVSRVQIRTCVDDQARTHARHRFHRHHRAPSSIAQKKLASRKHAAAGHGIHVSLRTAWWRTSGAGLALRFGRRLQRFSLVAWPPSGRRWSGAAARQRGPWPMGALEVAPRARMEGACGFVPPAC